MAVNRPTFAVNTGANKKLTEKKTIYHDIKPDSVARIRVLPPVTEAGTIFFRVVNHFNLKGEEGFGTALSCLCEHGNEDIGEVCWICKLTDYLRGTRDKEYLKVVEKLRASPRWYVQALILDKETGEYVGPKLVGLSKTTADALNTILLDQDEAGDDFFCDPDKGQDITIRRTGSGLQSKYTVMPTGQKSALDAVAPGWEERIITDVFTAMDLKVVDADEQKRTVMRTFGDALDWDEINDNVC